MNVRLIHCGRLIFEDYTENYSDWTENEAVMILNEALKSYAIKYLQCWQLKLCF